MNDSQKIHLAPSSEPFQVLERGIVAVVKGPERPIEECSSASRKVTL
jgi:hypothetical protein